MQNQKNVTKNLKGKKLLILGGAFLHCELVRAAKRLGVETYVTDYLPIDKAPVKQIADHAWDLNVTDVDAIVERCRKENIDGIINIYYDPCQIPYQQICEKLGLPCFGTKEQYDIFTDKKRFLDTCVKYGVDIIPSYSEEDFILDNPDIQYPLFVKPSDSRGSRGQSICHSYEEVGPAIKRARMDSINGGVVIEHFMEHMQDLQLVLIMIDGEPYLEEAADMYSAIDEDGQILPYSVAILPPMQEEYILELINGKLCTMLKDLKLNNCPVFLQGFLDGERLYLYDPGLRLPANVYEKILLKYFNIDIYSAMTIFALTGEDFPSYLCNIQSLLRLTGTVVVSLRVYIRPGHIHKICGIEDVTNREGIIQFSPVYKEGDVVENWHDIRQSFALVVMVYESIGEAKETTEFIYHNLLILDEKGEDMKLELPRIKW